MKKIKLFIAALVLASAVVAISINVRTSNDPFLEANLEALSNVENAVELPCVKSTSVCMYLVKDADGNIYNASTAGLKNISSD